MPGDENDSATTTTTTASQGAPDESPPQQGGSGNGGGQKRPFKYTRSYKACLTCRRRKAKCDLGENDNPPCMRCRRERRECVFEADRSWNKRRKEGADTSITIYSEAVPKPDARGHLPAATASAPAAASQAPAVVSPEVPSHVSNASSSPSNRRTMKDASQDLKESLIKTVLASGSDALTLLSQAAVQRSREDGDDSTGSPDGRRVQENAAGANDASHRSTGPAVHTPSVHEAKMLRATYELWRSSKFVRMGWLSAEDAVLWIDKFYENMAPLSPSVTGFYANHANHRHLLENEPLLCTAILVISSRYHILPGSGGTTRSYFAHDRLFKYFQHMVMRLVLGQEEGTRDQLRNLGSIEALLLSTEWHARSLYFPPDVDGWDCNLIDASHDGSDTDFSEDRHEQNRGLRVVMQSVKRSDRMSWMFVGSALSLAHELDIYNDDVEGTDGISSPSEFPLRKLRIRRLLYVFANQLASRLGCTSILSQSVDYKNCRLGSRETFDPRQDVFLESWIELTKLLRSLCEIVFPSKTATQQLVRSGRYVSMVDHFLPLLSQWRQQHLDNCSLDDGLSAQLFVEYQYVRIFINSIGLQAVCERAGASASTENGPTAGVIVDPEDRRCIEEVMAGCCDLLEKVLEMFGSKDKLSYVPVRLQLRAVSGSMFLVKALAIGGRQRQIINALDVLERTVHMLRSSALDDMHLADRFASMLETHVGQVRRSAMSQARQPTVSGQMTRQGSVDPAVGTLSLQQQQQQVLQQQQQQQEQRPTVMGVENGFSTGFSSDDYADLSGWTDFSLADPVLDGWLSMPSNPTLASLLYSGGLSQWPQP